jgi:hypothetical protein
VGGAGFLKRATALQSLRTIRIRTAPSDSSRTKRHETNRTSRNEDRRKHAKAYTLFGKMILEEALENLTATRKDGRPARRVRNKAARLLLGPNECAYWCWVAEIEHALVVARAREIIEERDKR